MEGNERHAATKRQDSKETDIERTNGEEISDEKGKGNLQETRYQCRSSVRLNKELQTVR